MGQMTVPDLVLPYPALAVAPDGIWLADHAGVRKVERRDAVGLLTATPTIIVNAPVVAAKLGHAELTGLDLLELFAFVHPAKFVVPTIGGLAAFLDYEQPNTGAKQAKMLRSIGAAFLGHMREDAWPCRAGAWASAQALARVKWVWAPDVLAALGEPPRPERSIFTSLPKWEDAPPPDRPRTVTLDRAHVANRLKRLTGADAEIREGQRDYAAAVTRAFDPRDVEDAPNFVLAEAGTGIGKTLGYLAPASAWADEASGTVWLSTYTKALQRQLDAETAKLFPDPAERRRRVVVRKGRENYLCLLNLEDAVQGSFSGRVGLYARLVERWARYTAGGDMVGGDLPGWLAGLFGRAARTALTDRRGECVYAACPHYRRCFIERAARASADADLV
ncbi:MAG: ATP-dependent DNA helicase, partial [Pseudomonadota bacterium]